MYTRYLDEAVPALTEEFGYTNRMQLPTIQKIVLNIGVGEAVDEPKSLDGAVEDLLIITGQGHNSGERGPVLKDAVYHWLELNGDRFVASFFRAPGRYGGEGALWITLR